MLKRKFAIFSVCVVLLGIIAAQAAAPNRVTLPGGKKVFLSGMNLAWINFANDVGDDTLNRPRVDAAMKAIADSGANCMRIWLSTNGTNDPKYGTDGFVKGPGSQTVANIQKMLLLAKKHNILLMPVLLTHNWIDTVNLKSKPIIMANNIKLLQTEAGLQAYIDNYVKPVVTAIGNDPNLVCWEVCNEPEGMNQHWNNKNVTITKVEIQRLVNWVASAIHQAVPNVLVSNGAASLDSKDWYTDAALKGISGGKADGILDFYMIHFYGWNGPAASPFKYPCSHWNLDKPLVVGEFASSTYDNNTASSSKITDGGANVDTSLTYLDNNGYAGGLGWQYQPDGGDSWLKGFATFGHALRQVYRSDSASIKLTGSSSNTFVVSASASSGGTVKKSIAGRVDSLKTDTLTATASTGFTFTGWTGDTTATTPILIIKNVVKDWSIHAIFTPNAGTNLIKSGDFSDETAWTLYGQTGNDAKVTFANQQANITITKVADDTLWKIQMSQGSIDLDSGVTLLVTFDAWSSGEREFEAGFSTAVTWHFQGSGKVSLTSTKKTYTVEITPDLSTADGILQFNCGGSLLPVYLKNVSVVKKGGSPVLRGLHTYKNDLVFFNRIGDRIFWSSHSKKATASLMDLSGRVIQSAILNNTVRLTNLPSGIYLFVINNGAKKQVFQIVK